jgi:ClpP class serine protease
MKPHNYTFITYGLLTLLIIFIYSLTFKYKFKTAQQLSFRTITNINSNKENFKNKVTEGFSSTNNDNTIKNDDVFKIIENKLKGLVQELGGNEGKSETKKILVNTKKICDLECAKCMMTMMSEKKSMKTIDLENILADETNENCIKCKKYTELSSSIKSIIDNL